MFLKITILVIRWQVESYILFLEKHRQFAPQTHGSEQRGKCRHKPYC